MNIQIDTVKYLNLTVPPEKVADTLNIEVSSHAYLPKTDDPESDWVASVAVPAFKLIRKRYGHPVPSFCSIGTGSGLDVLAAIELLGADHVGFTDLQSEVVETAAKNITNNLRKGKKVIMAYGAGDLLSPLSGQQKYYDVIYENLPNVPLDGGSGIAEKRNSGHFLEKRREPIPALVHNNMLDLHFLVLLQARQFLTENGSVYSTLGARVNLDIFRLLGLEAGYDSQILTYSWKIQAEAEDVLSGYARQEAAGLGPFHFYLVHDLRTAFSGTSMEESGTGALEIEKTLVPHQLSATEAWAAWKNGKEIGHTVAVLQSTPRIK